MPDLLGSAERQMDYLKRNIIPLVNDTINLLQDLEKNKLVSWLATENRGSDKLETLEGVDLRQLESKLKVKNQGRVLGNLYRIVNHEGHAKWVCLDHYRESAIYDLREVVKFNSGTFTEDTGKIEIDIATSLLAQYFYEALLIEFDAFFSRVIKYTLPSPKLQLFSMDWNIPSDDKGIKWFNGLLGQCSGLKALKTKVHKQYPTATDLMDTFPEIQNLESLKVDCGGFSITTSSHQDKIRDVSITIPDVGPIGFADHDFIRHTLFTQLATESGPSSDIGGKYAYILQQD
ncbi:hypothetical protein BGX34_001010 [Mortierella sp. NVP85]|nr:hypothetical protein BGX34_001010 [Mortierella sp. NVP85]